MKSKLIVLFIVLSTSIGFGQTTTAVDELFDKYAYKDGFTTVYISKYMFGLFSNLDDESEEEADELKKAIKGLESIRILTVDDDYDKPLNFFKEVGDLIPFDQYQPLMVVKEKDQDLRMLLREVNGQIVEFLMLGGGSDNLLISITGKLDLESIAKISESMDIEGLQNLEKLEDRN